MNPVKVMPAARKAQIHLLKKHLIKYIRIATQNQGYQKTSKYQDKYQEKQVHS